ncbi:hypothetical protein ACFO1B_55830 [Dactylosporangium siamense]|uniref:Uncharacterized protein n=1 Tax=Dactylosporangium siamense TaxID=685454 RepID=A0A919PHY8_9ACTN|nr:hypothetical protein [Dactylosporangium siamense]GIG42563.1 hypothetical protein Dsi01nite_006040 [Dactylosporangium siamense]
MGWNTSALFVQGSSTAEAVALLAAAQLEPGRLVGADEATSGLADGVLFAAEAGGWVQVWDPAMEFAPICEPPGTALTVVFASVASSYAFTLFEDGEVVRELVYADAEPVVDAGTPLPVEATVEIPSWGPDEDFVWAVIEAVTGTGYQDSQQFEVWRR